VVIESLRPVREDDGSTDTGGRSFSAFQLQIVLFEKTPRRESAAHKRHPICQPKGSVNIPGNYANDRIAAAAGCST
jgi:hypothetical protein